VGNCVFATGGVETVCRRNDSWIRSNWFL